MKKKTIRWIAVLVLILGVLAALCGCSSMQARLIRASQKLANLESMRMDVQLDSTMSMTLFKQEISLDMDVDGQADVMMKPLTVYMEMSTEVLGQDQRMLSYLQDNGTNYDLYLSTNGTDWQYKAVGSEEKNEQMAPVDQLKVLLALSDCFEESGKEIIRSESATVYTGVIPGTYVETLLKNTNLIGSLGKVLEVDLSGLELSDLGSVPVTLALGDKSGLPLRYTMDLTEVVDRLMQEVLEEALRQYGMEDLNLDTWGVSARVDKVSFSADFCDFDQVKEIIIPAAALNAKG